MIVPVGGCQPEIGKFHAEDGDCCFSLVPSVQSSGELTFLTAAIPGMTGDATWSFCMFTRRLTLVSLTVHFGSRITGEKVLKPSLCDCCLCNCWQATAFLFQEQHGKLDLFPQSSLKRFLDGVYFRNIMCRQEWMAQRFTGKQCHGEGEVTL